jgi:hypothetical protein
VKTLLSPRVSHTPAIAEVSDMGTISIITRGNDQLSYKEHEQNAQREDQDGGVASQLLLIGELSPLVADTVRQCLVGEPFHYLHC